jgi:hypothetical protein
MAYVEGLAEGLEAQQECPICLCDLEYPTMSNCGHIFCHECIAQMFNEKGTCRCPICRKMFDKTTMMAVCFLLFCCYSVVTLLLHCCYTVVTLLLHCCYTVVILLLHYCSTVVPLLLHCCHTVVELLQHSCYTLSLRISGAPSRAYAGHRCSQRLATLCENGTHTHTHTHAHILRLL